MAGPIAKVEVGFGSTWRTADADIVWTDLSDRVVAEAGVNPVRGATSAHGRAGAGTVSVSLENKDRHLDPLHTAGPYFGQLLPGVPIRVTSVVVDELTVDDEPLLDTYGNPLTIDLSTHDVYRGFVLGWPQDAQRGNTMTYVSIDAVDGFQNLARARTPQSPLDLAIRALNPLHYWPLDGDNGTTTVHDVTGRADGAIFDEPRFGEAPLFEGLKTSVDFDGVNDRIDVAGAPLIPDVFDCAIAAVVTADTPGLLNTYIRPIYTEVDGTSGGTMLSLLVNVDGMASFRAIKNGMGYDYLSADAVVGDGPHLLIGQVGLTTTDAGSGVAVDSATLSTTLVGPGSENGQGAAIGGMPGAARGYDDNMFDGRISNVAIWGTPLLAAERQILVDAMDAWTGDTTDERLDRVLDSIGWPADLRSFEPGRSTLGPARFENDSALDYARLIEMTEGGRLFVNASGQLRFLDRLWPYTATEGTTSQITFSDVAGGNGYADFVYDLDDELVINAVSYSRRGGETVRIDDDASQELHGIREDRQTDLLLRTDAEVRSRAHWTITTRSEALPRVKSIVIPLHAYDAADQATVLGLDLGHRVSTVRTPQGVGDPIELDFTVDGIQHRIGATEWWVELYVSPAPDNAVTLFTLGTSTLGGTHVLAH